MHCILTKDFVYIHTLAWTTLSVWNFHIFFLSLYPAINTFCDFIITHFIYIFDVTNENQITSDQGVSSEHSL